MNNKGKVRLIDFLTCLDPDDHVIINLKENGKLTLTLFEDTVSLSKTDYFLNEIYSDVIVIEIRYSIIESRYWIKVRRASDE